MTLDEKIEIIKRVQELEKAGNNDEAHELNMRIPLAPHLAKAAKEVYGIEYVKTSGFDLSEAEAEYGKDWLAR